MLGLGFRPPMRRVGQPTRPTGRPQVSHGASVPWVSLRFWFEGIYDRFQFLVYSPAAYS